MNWINQPSFISSCIFLGLEIIFIICIVVILLLIIKICRKNDKSKKEIFLETGTQAFIITAVIISIETIISAFVKDYEIYCEPMVNLNVIAIVYTILLLINTKKHGD